MKNISIVIATLIVLFCVSSATGTFTLGDYVPEHPHADNSTYGNIDEIATRHFHLFTFVDFKY